MMHVNRIYFRMRKTFRALWSVVAIAMTGSLVSANAPYPSQENDLEVPDRSDLKTPDWAKGLVWFQVFPERFRNGNTGNDPSGIDQVLRGWEEPWDLNSIEEIERAWNRGRIAPELFARTQVSGNGGSRQTIYSRRYGGDLQGVYEQLETIRDMGFTGVYICPVFQSRSLHKYDASDHRHIDPTLAHPGSYQDPGIGHTLLEDHEDPYDETTWEWTPGDRWFVDEFLPKAKSLGLRVMLDGVWNHVGLDHFAFQDVRINGADSEYADWFNVVFDDHGELIGWQGWSRINGSLPEFQHIGADIAPGPKAHVMAVTRRWMDPNGDGDPSDGIDGWRLDVAGEIGADFWRDWRSLVKSVNPDALIVAEIWHDAEEMLSDQAFDSQMNYPFAYVISDWLAIGSDEVRSNARVAANRLRDVFHHGREIDLVQLNLMGSHDTERLSSMMHNAWARGYDNESSRWFPRYDPDLVSADARARALAAIATMVASPGSVMIYNGDEFGLAGGDDPDNRRPIPWGRFSDAERAFNTRVSALLSWRSDPRVGPVLRFGAYEFDAIDDRFLRIIRAYRDCRVEIVIASRAEVEVGVESAGNGWFRDHETERKLMRGLESERVRLRVLWRDSGEADARERP